jgi:hypothetical protein
MDCVAIGMAACQFRVQSVTRVIACPGLSYPVETIDYFSQVQQGDASALRLPRQGKSEAYVWPTL